MDHQFQAVPNRLRFKYFMLAFFLLTAGIASIFNLLLEKRMGGNVKIVFEFGTICILIVFSLPIICEIRNIIKYGLNNKQSVQIINNNIIALMLPSIKNNNYLLNTLLFYYASWFFAIISALIHFIMVVVL
jgi:hypothetical protein